MLEETFYVMLISLWSLAIRCSVEMHYAGANEASASALNALNSESWLAISEMISLMGMARSIGFPPGLASCLNCRVVAQV